MSGSEIVSPVYFSAGKEEIPLVDVLKEKDLSIKNSLTSKFEGLSDKASKMLTSNKDLIQTLAGATLALKNDDFSLALSNINGLVSGSEIGKKFKSVLGDLGGGFKDTLSSTMKKMKLEPEKLQGIVSKISGEVSQINAMASSYGLEVSSVVNKFAGDSSLGKIINLDLETGIMTSMFQTFSGRGQGDLLEKIMDEYESGYDDDLKPYAANVIRSSIKKSLETIVNEGNLDTISKAVNKLQPGEALKTYPNIAKDILSKYKTKKNVKIKKFYKELEKLEETLNRADPSWFEKNKTDFSYETVLNEETQEETNQWVFKRKKEYNLFTFTDVSLDANKILSIHPDGKYMSSLLIGKEYKNLTTINTTQTILSHFKNLVLPTVVL